MSKTIAILSVIGSLSFAASSMPSRAPEKPKTASYSQPVQRATEKARPAAEKPARPKPVQRASGQYPIVEVPGNPGPNGESYYRIVMPGEDPRWVRHYQSAF